MRAFSAVKANLKALRKIWDQAPHNALTDLHRYRGRWFCVFREGRAHVSPEGHIRVIASEDGDAWDSSAEISIPGADLRDPKLSITPEGMLMLNAAAAYDPPAPHRHQSYVWFSKNGVDWSHASAIGNPNYWIWRVSWCGSMSYGIGYSTVQPPRIRLYSSNDGVAYRMLADNMVSEGCPNEATLAFREDKTALCLLRRDAGSATAMLGIAEPDYLRWDWKDLGIRIGGPHLLILPDGRIVAAFRRDIKKPWTSLNWLDPHSGSVTEFLALPSGGDTSYPGLCWHDGLLWVSYYSSHEERTSIYLAQIEIGT